MQVKPAPASCYRRLRVDETDCPTAKERLRLLVKVEALVKEDGIPLAAALKAVELPRSTYYDWRKALKERGVRGLVPKSRRPLRCSQPRWSRRDERRVLAARDARPFCGKRRIHHELKRQAEGFAFSVSTVGGSSNAPRGGGRSSPAPSTATAGSRRSASATSPPATPSAGTTSRSRTSTASSWPFRVPFRPDASTVRHTSGVERPCRVVSDSATVSRPSTANDVPVQRHHHLLARPDHVRNPRAEELPHVQLRVAQQPIHLLHAVLPRRSLRQRQTRADRRHPSAAASAPGHRVRQRSMHVAAAHIHHELRRFLRAHCPRKAAIVPPWNRI